MRKGYRAGALALAPGAVLLTAGCVGPRLEVYAWPADQPAADSVAGAMEALLGARPTKLSTCGPHDFQLTMQHLLGDLRPEFRLAPTA